MFFSKLPNGGKFVIVTFPTNSPMKLSVGQWSINTHPPPPSHLIMAGSESRGKNLRFENQAPYRTSFMYSSTCSTLVTGLSVKPGLPGETALNRRRFAELGTGRGGNPVTKTVKIARETVGIYGNCDFCWIWFCFFSSNFGCLIFFDNMFILTSGNEYPASWYQWILYTCKYPRVLGHSDVFSLKSKKTHHLPRCN